MKVQLRLAAFSVLSYLTAQVGGTTATPCNIIGSPNGTGFDVNFYELAYNDPQGDLVDGTYMTSGYYDGPVTNTASGIDNINFQSVSTAGIIKGERYGQEIYISNYTMELTGYFQAPESGGYSVILTGTDDSAAIFMGNGFACCDKTSRKDTNFLLYANYRLSNVRSAQVSLEAGQYYPMRIVYGNSGGPYGLQLSINTPSGVEIKDDWSSYIYQFPESDTCITATVSTTKPWTGTETRTSTIFSGSTEIVEVETPFSTFTSPWTGTVTRTKTVSNQAGSGLMVEVDTPIPRTTVPWKGSELVTTTISNPSGSGSLVEVETPLSTTFISWTGSDTTTITISNLEGSGSLVEVETPVSSEIETTLSTWTGSLISVSTYTSSGLPVVETLVPASSSSFSLSTETTFSTWSGSLISTTTYTSSGMPVVETLVPASSPNFVVSTETTLSTWKGISKSVVTFTSEGTPIVETLVPSPLNIDTTAPWTGSITSVTAYTSNGIPYVERSTRYSTISTPWTGTSTVTTLVPNPDGTGSVQEVLAPQSTIPTTGTWTGSTASVTTYIDNDTSIIEHITPVFSTTAQAIDPWTGFTASVATYTSHGIPYVEHFSPYSTINSPWIANNTINTLLSVPSGTDSVYEVSTSLQGLSLVTATFRGPCDKETAITYTTTQEGTVSVVVQNPTITASSTVDCGIVTNYKPCHECEAATYTTSSGGSFVVVVKNSTITATSNTIASNSSGSAISPSARGSLPTTTAVASVYEGFAQTIRYLGPSVLYPVLLLIFIF